MQRQKQFFRFEHSDFIKPEQFRIALANQPRVALGNPPKLIAPADAWIRWQTRREHLDIVYEPGKPPIHDNQINLWKGWGCVPAPGDVTPWSDLLDEAFGSGTIERIYFEQWIAFQIQRPGVKLFSAVVLWSPQQGVGKTLIGETCAKLFGENADTITNSDISGAFNEWVKGRQFILGEEIMSDDHRSAMNLLKHLITGETVRVNEKNQPKITLRNTINFMFTSNHPNAVQIDRNDRRFFVVEFAGGKRAPQFFTDFVNWRDEQGGLRALMHHLLQVSLDGFNPKAAPPATSAKEQMMEATFTDLERWIYDRYIDLAVPLQCEVVYAGDIANQYYGHKGQHATETAVGRALTRAGRCAKKRVTLSYGARKQLCAPRRYPYWSIAPEKAWAEEYEKGQLIGAQISAAITRVPATVPQSRHGLN